ncbi:hypothetical protein BR93DRAFT_946790 [Coniochaeta sp. PMI_546]|nr:hypothetical protein BR93DRAFT_946790 [Coniochaeta sp. PMI_546]
MFSIATAPAKQSVSETIAVYSGRLGSAVLLEDRRAAIVGLRSFAKQYPASVASGALRSLIGSLSKDGEDVDTVKLVLETLLMLFNPNEDSPEASEEIALWLADEFTQRQENITLLLDFLDTTDFYSRLYSLQLLSAILAARTERTEECVFNARLGISRLVAILDDRREAVRNEAITLLTYLTPTSLEIQKLVAFENAFDRVFSIIQAEGGLAEGGQVVEDCLILLANLLRLNSSNQALFRETGCVPRLSKLLETAYKADDGDDEVAPWAQVQKSRNIYALLAVIRLFLVSGAVGTAQNQASLFQHGLLFHALQLAFGRGAEIPIRSEHPEVRSHFLRRAIEGHKSGADETANVLTTLLSPPTEVASGDPYRYWFAAVLMLHLIYDNPATKALAMEVTEGDEASGEEVVTGIQTITAHLLGSLSRGDDSRIDLDAVNDFLGEGSNVQGLVQGAVQNPHGDPLVQGLCAMLLGVVYEFSTKDSPIPRSTLQTILTSGMGLRSHPFMRDYEKLPDDNYSRILRAIDREPGLEISVVTNGVQKGISREMVDTLRAQAELSSLNRQLGQEQADHRRTKESADLEASRAKIIKRLQQQNRRAGEDLERQLESARRLGQSEVERVQRRADAEKADLKATISRLEVDLMKASKSKAQELQELREQHKSRLSEQGVLLKKAEERATEAEMKLHRLEGRCKELEDRLRQSDDEIRKLDGQLKDRETERENVQSELDDLLMVYSDLEEKSKQYKERLRSLGQTSDSDVSDVSDEQEWLNDDDDDEGEEETVQVISLLDDRVFPDAISMISYCKEKYGFDFIAVRDRLQLDFHGTVKFINFIRQHVHEGVTLPDDISLKDIEDDRYLKPVLDDDALIMCLDDLPEPSAPVGEARRSEVSPEDLIKRNSELQVELEALAKQFNNYRLAVQQTLDTRWGEDDADAPSNGPSVPLKDSSDAAKAGNDYSESYFASYARNEIHETMLKDRVRTDAYRDFIYRNKHLFAGKVVLDIGCGTGILSMFCAKAGAKQAREIIFDNGLDDKIVCLHGRVEEVTLPVKQVDIIVSEWMGYCLLYEAMLPSVLWARDRYLKPDGLLVPSHASMWISPISSPGYFSDEYLTDHIDFWRDVYGFDMKAMQANIYDDVRIDVLPPDCLGATPYAFSMLDLHTVKLSGDAPTLFGFLLWFDIFFAPNRGDKTIADTATAAEWASGGLQRVAFTTGPFGEPTHWKQGVVINKEYAEAQITSKELQGNVSFSIPESYTRGLNIGISWETPDQGKKSDTWLLH